MDGEGFSWSMVAASDGNGLYCVITDQAISGNGYYASGGGEAGIGSGTLMPADAEVGKIIHTYDDVNGVAGALSAPIKIKGVFGASGGVTTSNGEISGVTGRRGPSVGGAIWGL